MRGMRIDCEDVGSARRFEGATRGGGIREEDAGRAGGAMRVGFADVALKVGCFIGAEARCAEFMAGNEGGGRLSSSSSSSDPSSSCALSVNCGTEAVVAASAEDAFGVV